MNDTPTFIVTAVSGVSPSFVYDGIVNIPGEGQSRVTGVTTSCPQSQAWHLRGFELTPGVVNGEYPAAIVGGEVRVWITHFPEMEDCP